MVAPLIILIVALGVFPKPVLDRITPSVDRLVVHVDQVTHTPIPQASIRRRRRRPRRMTSRDGSGSALAAAAGGDPVRLSGSAAARGHGRCTAMISSVTLAATGAANSALPPSTPPTSTT